MKEISKNTKNIQQMQKISLFMQAPVWHCRPTAPNSNHCSDESIDQTQAMNCSAKGKSYKSDPFLEISSKNANANFCSR